MVHKCINKLIYNKVEGKNVLKRGIVVALKNSILFACDALIFFYLMNRPNVEAKEKKEITDSLKQFLKQFNRIKAIVFGNIGEIDLERRAPNRAAEVLPTKNNVKEIIKCCDQSLQKMKIKTKVLDKSVYI